MKKTIFIYFLTSLLFINRLFPQNSILQSKPIQQNQAQQQIHQRQQTQREQHRILSEETKANESLKPPTHKVQYYLQ